jgi:hypothetical protein
MDADDEELEEVVGAVLGLVGEGPRPVRDLVPALVEGGFLEDYEHVEPAVVEQLIGHLLRAADGVWVSEHDMVASTAAMLDGTVFTHRATASELERGVLDCIPDLVVVDFDVEDGLRLPDGQELDLVRLPADGGDPLGSLAGPPGWLAGVSAGDLVAVRRQGRVVDVTVVDLTALGDGTAERAAIDAALAASSPEVGNPLIDVVLDALADTAQMFRSAVRPLGELLEAGGLEVRGEYVGTAGGSWIEPGVSEEVVARYRRELLWAFNPCCEQAFQTVRTAWIRHNGPDGSDEPPAPPRPSRG